jgi:hypothetical protein
MSNADDTLRTRISNIIYPFMPTEYPTPDDADEAADALILELPELQPCPFCGLSHYECDCLRKDVTDWKANDE